MKQVSSAYDSFLKRNQLYLKKLQAIKLKETIAFLNYQGPVCFKK